MVLKGALDILIFDESGLLTDRIRVGMDGPVLAYELPSNTYHTLVPQADESVFFEVKQGPYDPQAAAEYAHWAPAEGTPEAEVFALRLRHLEVGESVG